MFHVFYTNVFFPDSVLRQSFSRSCSLSTTPLLKPYVFRRKLDNICDIVGNISPRLCSEIELLLWRGRHQRKTVIYENVKHCTAWKRVICRIVSLFTRRGGSFHPSWASFTRGSPFTRLKRGSFHPKRAPFTRQAPFTRKGAPFTRPLILPPQKYTENKLIDIQTIYD